MVTLIALQSILCQLRVIEDFHTTDVRAMSETSLVTVAGHCSSGTGN